MTRPAFENAITIVMALGGSTNAVLHLMALAHEAGVILELEDFDRISRRTPHIGDMKPFGTYHMVDIDYIGGLPAVLRMLLDEGLLHGDCLTVTGKTMAENLKDVTVPGDQDVLRPVSEPIATEGGIAVLRGSLAPKGAVVKVAGIALEVFEGPARVFNGEQGALAELFAGNLHPGEVVVIRTEGPRGGPGMREMLAITAAIKGAGLGSEVLLITDGRFSGGTTGLCIGPRCSGVGGGRADRLGGGGRPDQGGCGRSAAGSAGGGGSFGRQEGGLEARLRSAIPPASLPSTPTWWAARRTEPSPTTSELPCCWFRISMAASPPWRRWPLGGNHFWSWAI